MRRPDLMRTLSFILLLSVLALPARAQDQPSPGPPEALVELVEDVRLGVRISGGFFHSNLSVAPIGERGLRFLGRPVSSEFSFTTPVYGVSAGLRAGRIELFGAYRTNMGLRPENGLRLQSGATAVPATYKTRQWKIRGQYFVFDNVGLGVVYRDDLTALRQVFPSMIAGEEVSRGLFSGSSNRQTLSLFVPARLRLGDQTTLFGKVGASVYGTGRDYYSSTFSGLQKDPRGRGLYVPPGAPLPPVSVKDADVNRQFARLGIEHPFFGMTWRFMLRAERVSVGDVSEEWRGGVRLQVGLPF